MKTEKAKFFNFKETKLLNFSFVKHIIVFFVGFVILNLLASVITTIIVSTLPGETVKEQMAFFSSKPVYQMTVMTISYLTIFIALALILLPNWKVIFEHFKDYRKYILGVLFGIGLMVFSALYNAIFKESLSNENQTNVVNYMTQYPLFAITIVAIVGPICEELTYRVGLFSLCAKYKKWLAYVVSALIFAVIHINFASTDIVTELISLPTYLVCGLTLAFAYDKFGLATSTTAHVTNNLIAAIGAIMSTSLGA